MSEDEKLNNDGPSGSGTIIGYSVEARHNYHTPTKIGDVLLDTRWRKLHFP